jgi:hypothetical protein
VDTSTLSAHESELAPRAARVIVKVGKHSNRLHIDVTLTPDQEKRLLKMLRKRNPEKK